MDGDGQGRDQAGPPRCASEDANSYPTGTNHEEFPEPRPQWIEYVDSHMPGYSGDLNGWEQGILGSEVNHFFPWTMLQDGRLEETLNHVRRHELYNYIPCARDDDGNVVTQIHIGPFTANFLCGQLKAQYTDPTTKALNYPAVFQYSMFAALIGAVLLFVFFHPPSNKAAEPPVSSPEEESPPTM